MYLSKAAIHKGSILVLRPLLSGIFARRLFCLGLVRYRMDAAKWVWLSAHVQRALDSRTACTAKYRVQPWTSYIPVVETA